MSSRKLLHVLFISFTLFIPGTARAQSLIDPVTEKSILTSLRNDSYNEAFTKLKALEELYQSGSTDKTYVKLLLNVASILNEKGNYELGLAYSFDALNLAGPHDALEIETIEALLEIGYVYFFLEQHPLSIDYTARALAMARKNNHSAQIASAINLLGTHEQRKGNYVAAYEKFDSALRIRRALNDFHGQSATLGNIGLLMEQRGQLNDAMHFQLQAFMLDDSIHDELGVAWSNQMLGSLSTKMKNFDQAKKYLDKAEPVAKRLKSNELLIQIFASRKDLLAAQGNAGEALGYADRHESLKDSLYNKALLGRLASLQGAYELDLKTKEIAEQKLALSRQRNYIIIAVIITVIVGLLAYFYFRSFRQIKKLHHDVAEQHEEIQMQAEELTEANNALTYLNREIAAQKEEIQTQAEELEESNQTISEINQNLEQTIRSRTAELVQAYKELDTFFYRASHDFRRPLTTFMGLSEVAKITVKDPYVLELFEKVKQTAHHLDRMLMKLQSISDVGLQQLSMKEVFVGDLFHSVFTAHQDHLQEAGVNFKTEIAVGSFNSYPTLIKLVLENLVENAVHFKKGTNSYVNLKAYKQAEEIVIEVSDNGQGIKNEYQPRIFEMYFRGNENSKGNGLGLYIVKKAVEKLHGSIAFTSVYPEGTTFVIHLPDLKS